jgi:hypothetical protein
MRHSWRTIAQEHIGHPAYSRPLDDLVTARWLVTRQSKVDGDICCDQGGVSE